MNPGSRDYGDIALNQVRGACRDALGVFEAAGFGTVEPGTILEAESLLDLYGEDVRARAFVFEGTDGADLCLRPDLTLAICRMYLASGFRGGEARYAASGPVYRRPSRGETRPAQFLQVGCEWFGAEDPAQAEARVFKYVCDSVEAIGVTDYEVATGDLGVLFALIDATPIPERWRVRLKRHVWRPKRFQALLDDYAGETTDDPGRRALLKALGSLEPDQARAAIERMLTLSETSHVGLRTPDEVAERLLEQAQDARAHPLPRDVVSAIETAATMKAPCGEALSELAEISRAVGIDIGTALGRFEARLEQLQALGVDAAALPFDGEFGRNLEYYDGFVFELYDSVIAETFGRRAAQLGGGGRYDGMLGAAARAFGVQIEADGSAIGCAIRPETVLAVREGGA